MKARPTPSTARPLSRCWTTRWPRLDPQPSEWEVTEGGQSSSGICPTPLEYSGHRCLVNALDGRVQCRVELGVALLDREACGKSTREARDHTVVAGESRVRLGQRVTAR